MHGDGFVLADSYSTKAARFRITNCFTENRLRLRRGEQLARIRQISAGGGAHCAGIRCGLRGRVRLGFAQIVLITRRQDQQENYRKRSLVHCREAWMLPKADLH
jgi:hypothetical protein